MRILLVGVLLAGCSDSTSMPPDPPGTCEVTPGSRTLTTTVDGETRYYWLHIPQSYQCESTPVLVDFHGTAGDKPEVAYQTEALEAFSEAHGVIVVRPRSRSSLEGGYAIYRWDENPGDLATNVTYTKQLVGELEQAYTIDAQRIYASGFSSGSNMVAQFIGDPGSPFAGLAPIAGGWWTKTPVASLADGPRIYMSTGYRDYLWPYARDLIEDVAAEGLPADRLTVRHTGGGHDLYAWHFDELWQWLDDKRGFGDEPLAPGWTAETVESPDDITVLARDGSTLLAAGAHGHVWKRGATGWTVDLSRDTADYSALCVGSSSALVGGNFTAVERSTDSWGADESLPDYGQQFGQGWVNAADCRDDGSIAVVGYWSSAIRTGSTWSRLQASTPYGVDAQLAGVASTPGGATIVAGYYDYIGRAGDGETVTQPMSHGITAEWWNGVATAGGRFWVVGDNGSIVTSVDDGMTWTPQTSGTTENLYAVTFVDANHGAAVGRRGTVLVTSDGGTTWTLRPLGRDIFLGGVAIDDTTITVAGEGGLIATSAR
jgi:poly(3-hydroxybutyrate) depolymerase